MANHPVIYDRNPSLTSQSNKTNTNKNVTLSIFQVLAYSTHVPLLILRLFYDIVFSDMLTLFLSFPGKLWRRTCERVGGLSETPRPR